jgi:hypothetical protein
MELDDLCADLAGLAIDDKQKIIAKFTECVKGKPVDLTGSRKHCGAEGHWLEKQMGIVHNSKNAPDLYGYEMKKDARKITFGDFSASEYLFHKNTPILDALNGAKMQMSRGEFIRAFGMPNAAKSGRCSWSGKCVPRYGEWNAYGQMLEFDESMNLLAKYSPAKDTRERQKPPESVYVFWAREKLRRCVEDKFGSRGFFICKKIGQCYEKICFGGPFNFEQFAKGIKEGRIFFDSGMYEGNARNYSQFRGNRNFWQGLIVEEF